MIEPIKRAVKNTGGGALFFSGGLDSSIIGKVLKDSGIEFKCFTAGIPGAKDLEWSEKACKQMGFSWEKIQINEYGALFDEVISEFDFDNVIDISIAVPFFAACKKASMYSKKGITGLGADEIFAGYGSHKRLYPDFEKIDQECKIRAENVKKDLKRDRGIASFFGMRLYTPFLDKKVVEKGLEIPAQKKINQKKGKLVLRKMARDLGIPKKISERKKKAFQYGSSSIKALKKLAKKHGFKKIRNFLESRGMELKIDDRS